MKTLSRSIDAIGFFEREKSNGRYLRLKCERDFLYYALNYYFPDEFNVGSQNPVEIEHRGLFGISVPASLAWTQIQYYKAPALLKERGLTLYINDKRIVSFLSLVSALLFSRKSYEVAMREIETCIDRDEVCGVDVSLKWQGLLDHVLFVHGYDVENVYVIDTHRVPYLEYERIGEAGWYFRLPKSIVQKRWKMFSRVWRVVQE